MRRLWTAERSWHNVSVSSKWSGSLSEYAFSIDIECTRKKDVDVWTLGIAPEETCSYSLLVDICLTVNDTRFLIERDLWEQPNIILQEETPCCANYFVTFQLLVIQTLSPQQLEAETPYRNFEIICEDYSVFVDTLYLSSLGGRLFTEWHEMNSKGKSSVELTDLASTELMCLIDATAKFRQIVITRSNYDLLASISFRYGIASVLRAIETYLIDAEKVNPIRKMEFAVSYKLARLGDVVSRNLISSGTAMEQLHDYLAANGNTLEQAHPDVLASLNIYPDYVLL